MYVLYFYLKLDSLAIQHNCGALRDLVPFVQFKKREKHPWRSVNFSKISLKPATLLKLALLHGCFSRFLNCTNGTKSRSASQLLAFTDVLKNPIIYHTIH